MEDNDVKQGRGGRRPTHRIWHVEGTGDDAKWTEICALWPTKTARGLSGGVDSFLPAPGGHLQGRMVVLPARYKTPSGSGQAEEGDNEAA